MVRKTMVGMAALAALSGAGAQDASAQGTTFWSDLVCGGSTLSSCIDFSLAQDGDTYYFTVKYESSLAEDAGVVKAAGLYDLAGDPDFDFYDLGFFYRPNDSWLVYDEETCNLTGGGAGAKLFEACADRLGEDTNVEQGLHVGEWVTFSFKSTVAITESHFTTSEGGLGARAHLQSFGEIDCSLKFSTREHVDTGERVWSDDEPNIDNCGVPTSVVPEPMSMLLLGTGLVGVGGVALRRRRNGLDVDNA